MESVKAVRVKSNGQSGGRRLGGDPNGGKEGSTGNLMSFISMAHACIAWMMERLVSEMTCYVSSWSLNSTHSPPRLAVALRQPCYPPRRHADMHRPVSRQRHVNLDLWPSVTDRWPTGTIQPMAWVRIAQLYYGPTPLHAWQIKTPAHF